MLASLCRGARPIAVIAATALLAAWHSGCGDEDDQDPASPVAAAPTLEEPSPERAVARVVRRMQAAFAAGDLGGVCEYLSEKAKLQVGTAGHGTPSTCRYDVARWLPTLREGGFYDDDTDVVAVELVGDRAVATVAKDLRHQVDVYFRRIDGAWRLETFFGEPDQRARNYPGEVEQGAFPPAVGPPVLASDARGNPCPRLDAAAFPRVSGGCTFSVSTPRAATLTVATAVGELDLSDCLIHYQARVDAQGRTWIDRFAIDRDVGEFNACGDVYSCLMDADVDNPADTSQIPIRGRLVSTGGAGFVHKIDICVASCLGYFVGRLDITFVHGSRGWRAEAADASVGRSGLRFDTPFEVETRGLQLRAGAEAPAAKGG